MEFKERNMCLSALRILGHEFHETARDHGFWDRKCGACTVGKVQVGTIEENNFKDCTLCSGTGVIYDPQSKNKGELIALMHSELSEALEGIRKPGPDEHIKEYTSEEVELADAVIRILEYGTAFNLMITEAMVEKNYYNKSRPHNLGMFIMERLSSA